MNVAVLWKVWNDYLEAALDELSRKSGVRVLLCEVPSKDSLTAPRQRYAPIERCQLNASELEIAARLENFDPDLILVCSWDVRRYRRLARRWRGRALRVVYMDNQWLGTPRQRLGILASPLYLWPCFDAAFVAGERQSKFASRLGFGERRSQTGGVVGDTRKFAGEPSSSGFLFVGRLVHQKAPDILGEAYAAYRANREDPWPLRVCGVGPDARILAEVAGVEMMGFVQPSELPAVMAMCACLVLPSRFEPFGVVVHEAVAMGLHVIASTAVGAADLFVDDEVNGRIVLAGDAFDLAKALDWMHDRTDEARLTGIQRSHDLSLRRSPQMWSAALLSLYARFDPDRRSYGRARLLR